jgi:hypothetical protein
VTVPDESAGTGPEYTVMTLDGRPTPAPPLSATELARLDRLVGAAARSQSAATEQGAETTGAAAAVDPAVGSVGALTLAHFEEALTSVRRSVTEDELGHFLRVHAEMSGEAPAPPRRPGQRSTLA